MTTCLVCGKENERCLCSECAQVTDIEKLCDDILHYDVNDGTNDIWNQIIASLVAPYNFKNIIIMLSEFIPSPKKEMVQIKCIANKHEYVPKKSRPWLYKIYEQLKQNEQVGYDDMTLLLTLMLTATSMDYRYKESEEFAKQLCCRNSLNQYAYYALGDYYTKTRRYDEAETILTNALNGGESSEASAMRYKKLLEDNESRRNAAMQGKKEYMPNPNGKEEKERAQQAYVDLLNSLGIEVVKSEPKKSASVPEAIPKDQYPLPLEIRDAQFDSFVAYDLETTGFSNQYDAMIEIGAIKVIDGQLIESSQFTFQEFVRPFKKSISDDIIKLTGITSDDVKDARQMWEVFADFMKFVGDLPLVGYNNIAFDMHFLVRAGRYSNIVMHNAQFDVMHYVMKFKDELGVESSKTSLDDIATKLEIVNPQAHRALADAITTAKVFLKLKEMDSGESDISIDDMLSDLDSW